MMNEESLKAWEQQNIELLTSIEMGEWLYRRDKNRDMNERPKGEWARHDKWVSGEYVGGFYHINCPNEDGYYSKWETNFCPNCGAEMERGTE